MGRFQVWDYGARPGTDSTTAIRAAVAAAASAGGGDVIMPYGDEGSYYVQHQGGNPLRPVSGYMGVELQTGVYLHGDEGTPIASLPPAMGGLPGQLVGVRLDSANDTSVHDIGLIGVALSNTNIPASPSANENCHAAMFHSTQPGKTITNITLEGVKVTAAAWGDGVYFGSGAGGVYGSRGSVTGVKRHGVTLASSGVGRSDYLLEDWFMGEVTNGHPFHIESDYNYDAADAAKVAGGTWDQMIEAGEFVRDVELRRCLFAGHIAFNGVADWSLVDCTARPKASGTGGGIQVVNSPRGKIIRGTYTMRNVAGSSAVGVVSMTGFYAGALQMEDVIFVALRRQDGTLPSSVLYARQYSGSRPGWPSDILATGYVATPAGVPMANAHSGTGWNISGLTTL